MRKGKSWFLSASFHVVSIGTLDHSRSVGIIFPPYSRLVVVELYLYVCYLVLFFTDDIENLKDV
jgi:hypothetical protein